MLVSRFQNMRMSCPVQGTQQFSSVCDCTSLCPVSAYIKAVTCVHAHADEEPWCGVRKMLDEAWYIDSNLEEAMGRVFARQTGNGAPPEEVQRRIDTNDRPNALQISATKERAHLVIPALPLCSKT